MGHSFRSVLKYSMSPRNMLQLGALRKHEGLSDFSPETNPAFPSLFLQRCWEKVVWPVRESRQTNTRSTVRESRPTPDYPKGRGSILRSFINQRSFIMCCFFWPPMNAIILYSEELLPMVIFEENVGIFFLFLSKPTLPSPFPKGTCLKASELLH